jgi:hypothetical protein
MMCWSGSSPAGYTLIQITATLSDMSDHLSLVSSCSMFCYIDGMDYRMLIMVMFIRIIVVFTLITLIMLALCMLELIGANLNFWLN